MASFSFSSSSSYSSSSSSSPLTRRRRVRKSLNWQRRSQALTDVGNIAGEESLYRDNEAEMIEKVDKDVLDKPNATPSKDFDGKVGLEVVSREIQSLLDSDDKNRAMVVGICGPAAAIGKTTTAGLSYIQLVSFLNNLLIKKKKGFLDNLWRRYRSVFDDYGSKLREMEFHLGYFVDNLRDNYSILGDYGSKQLLQEYINRNGIAHLLAVKENLREPSSSNKRTGKIVRYEPSSSNKPTGKFVGYEPSSSNKPTGKSKSRCSTGMAFLVIINLLLEIASTVSDQLSSVRKPYFARISLLLSILSVVISFLDLSHKIRAHKARFLCKWPIPWFYYDDASTIFGSFADTVVLFCAVGQLIVSTINCSFIERSRDGPIKVSVWPLFFAIGMVITKFMENPANSDDILPISRKDDFSLSFRDDKITRDVSIKPSSLNKPRSKDFDDKVGRGVHWRKMVLAGEVSQNWDDESKMIEKTTRDVSIKPLIWTKIMAFLVINLLLEIASAVSDQLSSIRKPYFARISLLLSIFSVVISILDLSHKIRARKARFLCKWPIPWFYYDDASTIFGSFADTVLLFCAVGQLIVSTINCSFIERSRHGPIKVSVWPLFFAIGMVISKFMENPVISVDILPTTTKTD